MKQLRRSMRIVAMVLVLMISSQSSQVTVVLPVAVQVAGVVWVEVLLWLQPCS